MVLLTNTKLISFYRMRLEIQRALLLCKGETELWQRVCDAVIGEGGMRLAWVGLCRTTGLVPVASAAAPPELLERAWPCPDIGLSRLTQCVLERKRVQFCHHEALLPPQMVGAGLRSACALPLKRNGRLYGVLEWYSDRLDFRGDREVALLEELSEELEVMLTVRTDELRKRRRLTRLAALAYRDPLTGLPNRRFLKTHLRCALAQARDKGQGLAVMLLDLDGFKGINDRFGHAAGDRLLRRVAGAIRNQLRPADVVVRLGGDEFAVVLTECHRLEETERIAADLIRMVRAVPLPQGGAFILGASVGIALFPEHGDDPQALLQCADEALYLAKAAGRNRFCCYGQLLAVKKQMPR